MHLQNKCYSFPKKQLFQLTQTLWYCKGISTGLVHVKTIAVFFTRVQFLAENFISKVRHGKCQ